MSIAAICMAWAVSKSALYLQQSWTQSLRNGMFVYFLLAGE